MKTTTNSRSINQLAQESGDSSANEGRRIRDREAAVKAAWRRIAYDLGESSCSAAMIAAQTELPAEYVALICERNGYRLA